MANYPSKVYPVQFSILGALAGVVVLSFFMPALVSIVSRWNAPPSLQPAGPAATFYLLGCVGVVLFSLWIAGFKWTGLFLWALLSMPLGILGLFIPFGGATVALGGGCPEGFAGFCGEGVPVPLVIWDKGADFPGPLAILVNSPFVFVLGAIVFAIARFVARRFWLKSPSVIHQS